MRKGIISIIFCIIAVFSLVVTAQAFDIDETNYNNYQNTHYGYSLLEGDERLAYQAIYSGIQKEKGEISLEGLNLNLDSVKKVYFYYLADSPEHYWLWADSTNLGFNHPGEDNNVTRFIPNYNGSRTTMTNNFEGKARALLAGIDKSLTKKEKALIVHDRLVEWVNYDYSALSGENSYAHRAYGAITNNLAVCDGYSYAYQILLNKLGIRAITVSGYGTSTGDLGYGSHAWNLVELTDGNWSYIDVTWDDGTDGNNKNIYHYYFGNGEEMIAGTSGLDKTFNIKDSDTKNLLKSKLESPGKKDHYIVHKEKGEGGGDSISSIPFKLPANIVRDSYFDAEHTLSELTVDGLSAIINVGNEKATSNFIYTGTESIEEWLNKSNYNNYLNIAKEKNYYNNLITPDRIISIDYNLQSFRKELFLNIYYAGGAGEHTHSGGTATCISKAYCSICHEQYGEFGNHKYVHIDRKAATTEKTGLEEHFYCPLCHEYFDKDKKEVKYEDLIIKKYTPGDINGDRAVNNKDVIVLFRYLSGAEMGEGFSLDACDPNNDGEFNNKDVNRLFNYISYPSKRETDYVLH